MKSKFIFFLYFYIVFAIRLLSAQTSYPGLNTWYHPQSIAMAGAGFSMLSVESDIKNPALLNERKGSLHLALLLYPAKIEAGIISLSMPRSKRVYSFGLRHLNYGFFDGYDEYGNQTGPYTSGDEWLTVSVGERRKGNRIALGGTLGGFFSQLESYQSFLITFTVGALLYIDEFDAKLGLSLGNYGFIFKRYTRTNEQLPTRLVGSFVKKLAHLPLQLSIDIGYELTSLSWFRFGGIFQLPYRFQLRAGMSSDKYFQKTGNSISSDYLGSSGVGLSYAYGRYSFDISGYFFGTGGWISGIGTSIKL